MSQNEASEALEITRSQIANIEAVRVPLKFWVGDKFCRLTNLSQLWLATGQLPRSPYNKLDKSFYEPAPSQNALFTEVCLGPLKEILRVRHRYFSAVQDAEKTADFLADSYQLLFHHLIPTLVFEVPQERRLDFIDNLIGLTRRFAEQGRKQFAGEIKPLTPVTELCNPPNVKSEMDLLRSRLQRAAEPKGKKTALAQFLNVPLSRVSEWLSDKGSTPNGETTLLMLKWVELEEKK